MSYKLYIDLMGSYAGCCCPELLLRTRAQFDDKQLIVKDILIALKTTSGHQGKTTITKACNLALYADVYLNISDVLRCDSDLFLDGYGYKITNVENSDIYQEICKNSHLRCI